MPTMVFRFPGGRYHATPWGHHVNEGLVEWPPSPWRMLRALLATGYTKLRWDGQPPAVARSLIERLADVLPMYQLPPAVTAHSRHYMRAPERPTLVFDTWADVGDGELAVTWPVDLPSEEMALLSSLAGAVGYLGRADSWVEARLAASDQQVAGNAYPSDGAANPGPGWEQTALLAPLPAADYAAWRASRVTDNLGDKASARRTAAAERKERSSIEAQHPSDLLACLQVDTAWLQAHGWSQPPGSRQVLYWRSSDALSVAPPIVDGRTAHDTRVEVVLLALSTPTLNRHALPSIVRTLPQAELLHRSLVAQLGRHRGESAAPEIIGRDEARRPLRGHRHAHVLPVDLDGDGRIEHVILWAPCGLGSMAQQAAQDLRRTWMKGGLGELRVTVEGRCTRDDLRRLPPPYGDAVARLLGPPPGARRWVSVTPFVPPRHLKRSGRHTLEGQVQEELASRDLPAAATVTVLPREEQENRRFRHYVRVRSRGGVTPPEDKGVGLCIDFPVPVQGPLCLGYASHFGLGLFAAAD